jgi:hypothetical protein
MKFPAYADWPGWVRNLAEAAGALALVFGWLMAAALVLEAFGLENNKLALPLVFGSPILLLMFRRDLLRIAGGVLSLLGVLVALAGVIAICVIVWPLGLLVLGLAILGLGNYLVRRWG